MTPTPDETWDLRGGTARVFTAGAFTAREGLIRPVLLAGDPGTKAEDLTAAADHPAYSLLAALRGRGHDLVLIALEDPDASLPGNGAVVQRALQRTLAKRQGTRPLAVGGTLGGALAARYTLTSMEYQRIDHRTEVFLSHNAAAPAFEDEADLARLGTMPRMPRNLRLTDGPVSDGLTDTDFDETRTAPPTAPGPLLPESHGSWLLGRLP
ncbi:MULTISPECIES: hypothetical protein [unclassified Streptomyces]|uniref:hypothetical protein n=1 Tax=unclassified Streptomyces TaxID=2593676 RepID=UPI0016605633|nr:MULTISPECIES: hypothetical protein [unclassified Streptomyces]MBD0708603.1 hypothetical protein [Streptomyces sp. CBMA291]MBD0713134.1 hypothetical protein [Streptomyces sp. CBMA370]